jgi:hypothetical protein
LELLGEPHTLEALVARRPIYRRPREPAFVYDHMEGQMLQKHLDRLVRRGLVAATAAGTSGFDQGGKRVLGSGFSVFGFRFSGKK